MPKDGTKNIAPDADDNEEILAFLQGDVDRAPEPGDVVGTIVNTGNSEETPFPAVISETTSAGYVTLYNRVTGDPSVININNLPAKLKQRYNELDQPHYGELVFTLRDPGFRPPQGAVLCWLHADHPRRKEFDAYGFAVCPAGHLQSEYQRDRHAEKRHATEFANIKDMIQREKDSTRDEIEAQDREERRKLLEIVATRG